MAIEANKVVEAMFRAIDTEDASALRAALTAGADADAMDANGNTPLHNAIVAGNAALTQLLLEAGADPNRGNAKSHPPLVLVAKLESPLLRWASDDASAAVQTEASSAMILSLAAHGAEVAQLGPEAASFAVTNCSVAVLKALDEAGLAWNDRWPGDEDARGFVPLVDRLFVQALLSGVTTPEVVTFLLQHGADINGRDRGRPLLSGFLARGADLDVAVLRAILAASPDINATDSTGETALMHAASRLGDGRATALELLLAAGADPKRKDLLGRTALDRAAGVPAPEAIKVLCMQGSPARKPSDLAMPAIANGMAAGGFFISFPIGEPPCLLWVGVAQNSDAALDLLEQHYVFSRSPVGPFPVLQLLHVVDAGRTADPGAARYSGKATLGELLVLSFTAVAPKDYGDRNPLPENLRPLFVVTGVYPADAQAAAESFAKTQPGWTLVARLVTLTIIEDGYRRQVAELIFP